MLQTARDGHGISVRASLLFPFGLCFSSEEARIGPAFVCHGSCPVEGDSRKTVAAANRQDHRSRDAYSSRRTGSGTSTAVQGQLMEVVFMKA